MRSPLQTRLPPVTPCQKPSHLNSDGDASVTAKRDGVKCNKMKSLTILNTEDQSNGLAQLPLRPIRQRPLSPELVRKEAIHHRNNKHTIRKRFTPQMVAHLAGTTVSELKKLVRLEVCEDLRDIDGVECIGQLLPTLEHLVLDDGQLPSLNYLGTNLKWLKNLSAARVGICNLDGIGTLSGHLVELRLPGNHISDVTPLAYNDTINILDLSSNLITNMSAIDVLGSCSRLIALNLDGNPLTEIMKSVLPANIARRVVCSSLPSLKRLDEINVTQEDSFTGEYGAQEAISWAREVISIEVDKISIEGAAAPGSFPLSSLAGHSSHDNAVFSTNGGHTTLNDSPIAALRKQKCLGIKAELHKEGTLQHPPVSSLVNHNGKCDLKQGCITFTGAPSISLRRNRNVEKKIKGEIDWSSIEGTTDSEFIGKRNAITGLSYDSELTRGHETLTGAPTAALRRRKRLDEEVVVSTSDIQDRPSKLGLLEILDLAKAMEAETEKKDNETTDPMLEQLVCQWRKDVEEFDAQVLSMPSAEIRPGQCTKQHHIVTSSRECPISPTRHLFRRSKHLSMMEIEDDDEFETPESVLPLPTLEEFRSRKQLQRRGEIGGPSATCESHISAQRRVRKSVLRKLESSKTGRTLHRVDNSSSSDTTSDVSSSEYEAPYSDGEGASKTLSREALKCRCCF